jgi:serine protease Do
MKVTELFDDYLQGSMDETGKLEFERRLESDPAFAQALRDHRALVKTMRARADRDKLKAKLKEVHAKEFGERGEVIPLLKQGNFAVRHGRTIAIAASTAFIVVLGALAILSTGGYLLKQQSNQITDLNRVVRELKASSDAIMEGIVKSSKKVVYAPANLEGSAFAISSKGYVITSLHMVKGADSIFIQNKFTERTHAKIVFSDPSLDLAILKADNSESTTWQLPFSMKDKAADIGDRVFTLGYPRREMVYGEGAVSAASGYMNDTSMYQVSIPVNPGNSGGPLVDEGGNVIGVIRSKISGAEATGFAIKANAILSSIQSLEDDSLRKDILESGHKKQSLRGLKRSEQIKRIHPYVFNVLVYKD